VLLSVYLALAGGGYDIVVRSEIGLIVWWFVVLGVLIGVLPRTRVPRAGWIATALLGGFLVWTWIGLSWSSSHELTLNEVGRLSTYLGIFVLGLCALSAETTGPLINGLGCGIAIVSAVAILSKLTPSLFPTSTARSFYATPRLAYPFDYSDGVGEYVALGIPLLLYMATSGRTLLGRALSAGALQVVLLCLAMTVSRGGILAAFVGIVVFFALAPNRIPRLPTLLIAGAGIALLMVALLHRPELRDSLKVAPAAERHSMLLILIVVAAGCAVAQGLSLVLMQRTPRPAWLQVSRRGAQGITAGIVVAALLVVAVGFAGGTVSHLWNEFKLWLPAQQTNQYFRLLSLAGSHRYQYWQVAWHAFTSSPFHGIGPGTFHYYWFQHTTNAEYILNAHSLWFETLAETGIVGWLLLVGFFGLILVGGAMRALRAAAAPRTLIATTTAGVAAFCAAASFDWVWQIGVVPMVALLLASAGLVTESQPARQPVNSTPPTPRAWWTRTPRLLTALGGFLALGLIAIPLASTVAVRNSQAAAAAGDLRQALADAHTAQAIEPGASTPYLQQALVLEKGNNIKAASAAIAAAIAREPINYFLWLEASRIATESDQPRRAVADFQRAKRLYPTSTVFPPG
jgi:O-antigen ligase